MASIKESIQSGIVAALEAFLGAGHVRTCAPNELLSVVKNVEGGDMLHAQTLPPAYPGGVVSLNDNEIEIRHIDQQNGHAIIRYAVPIGITLFATTGGTLTNGIPDDPRFALWTVEEGSDAVLSVFAPPLPDGCTPFALIPDRRMPILADAGSYGMLTKWWAEYLRAIPAPQ